MAKIKKKKERGMNAQDKAILRVIKEGFLNMCEQYERTGKLYALLAEPISDPSFISTGAQGILNNIILQNNEIGESLKEIGLGLDLLGRKPIMQDPNVKKTDVEEDEEETKKIVVDIKTVEDGYTFISNIAPEPEKKEEKAYDDITGEGQMVFDEDKK